MSLQWKFSRHVSWSSLEYFPSRDPSQLTASVSDPNSAPRTSRTLPCTGYGHSHALVKSCPCTGYGHSHALVAAFPYTSSGHSRALFDDSHIQSHALSHDTPASSNYPLPRVASIESRLLFSAVAFTARTTPAVFH